MRQRAKEFRFFAVADKSGYLFPDSIRYSARACREVAALWLETDDRAGDTDKSRWKFARDKYGWRVIPVLVRPE